MAWKLTFHLFGMLIWFAGIVASLRMLSAYNATPSDQRVDFKQFSGKVGLLMDIGAGLTVVMGLWLISNKAGLALFKAGGFMHAKLTLVVVLIGLHGFVRVKLAKYRKGSVNPTPGWLFPLVSLIFFAIVLLIEVRPF